MPGRLGPDPGSEAVACAQALLEETHFRLLAVYPADAVIHATALAELALGEMSGAPTDARADLGALIDELQRTRPTDGGASTGARGDEMAPPAAEGHEPLASQVRPECDADARRASEIATRLAQDAGLVTTQQAAVCETEAMRRASAREPGALHWLDRHGQRQALQRRLARRPRVLVDRARRPRTAVRQLLEQGRDLDAERPCRRRPLDADLAPAARAEWSHR